MLICNNPHCREPVTDKVMISFCSHIFCSKCFPVVKKLKGCLFCQEDLLMKGNDFNDPEAKIKMKLNHLKDLERRLPQEMLGLSFVQIMNIIKEPLEFCIFQNKLISSQNQQLFRQMDMAKNTIIDDKVKELVEKNKLEEQISEIKNERFKDRMIIRDLTRKLYKMKLGMSKK